MSESAYIVTLCSAAHAEEALGAALRALVARTREEPGCVECHLHRPIGEPDVFVVYERWRDVAAFDAHMATPHVDDFLAVANSLLAKPADVRGFEPLD